MIVIAFDPGHTTGYAVGLVTGPRDFDVLEAGEIPWEIRFDRISRIIRSRVAQTDEEPGDALRVVMEDFMLYKHAAQTQINSRFPSARVIGVIDFICWQYQIPVTFQMASVRGNVQIKHTLPASPHVHDAYQHLRYYILTNGAKLWPKSHSPIKRKP